MIILKDKKGIIISFIIGVIIASSITVYATSQYLASNVTYNNTNVANALDDLYSKVTTLTSEKNELASELDSLTTASKSFTFNSSLSTQTFNIGFRPKYISCTTLTRWSICKYYL